MNPPRRLSNYCVIACLLLSACASQGDRSQQPYRASAKDVPDFKRVVLVPQELITAIERGESAESRSVKGASTGALAGAGVGVAAAAVTCAGVTGPFAWLCLPAYLGYYGMIGMLAGSAVGATYGFSGLSHEDQLYLNEALSRIDQERNFQKDLEQAVQAVDPGLWCTREETNVRMVVRLKNIDLEQRMDDQVKITFYSEMDLLWEDDRRGPSIMISKHSTESEHQSIDAWLADGAREIEAAIDRAVEDMAQTMIDGLISLRSGPGVASENGGR